MNAFTPKGWCPGLARPMLSGDGLIARLRPPGAGLSAAQLTALADCAETFGNGLADLTSRGNVQLRGLRENALGDLSARLAQAGLDAPDPPCVILTSPLAGDDAGALCDMRALESALINALAAPEFAGLPAKFSIVLDDGGACPLGGEDADIRAEASRIGGAPLIALRLGGVSAAARFIGLCAYEDAARIICAVTRRFLAEPARPRRMRDAPHLAVADIPGLLRAPAPPTRPVTGARDLIGVTAQGAMKYTGVAAPFGRLEAPMMRALARALTDGGASALRVTPWRVLLIPGAPDLARLAEAGLVTNPGDPLLRVAACSGLGACASAETDVRADARALAPLAARFPGVGTALHVSGCVKGCARAAPSQVTLVGRGGRYDLVRGGTARAAPALCNLTRDAAEAALARLAEGGPLGHAAQ